MRGRFVEERENSLVRPIAAIIDGGWPSSLRQRLHLHRDDLLRDFVRLRFLSRELIGRAGKCAVVTEAHRAFGEGAAWKSPRSASQSLLCPVLRVRNQLTGPLHCLEHQLPVEDVSALLWTTHLHVSVLCHAPYVRGL